MASTDMGTRFRDGLARFATGVAFVTTSIDGRPAGLIVNSFSSVSLDPPLVSFCPALTSLTWSRMRRSGRFGVNILASGQDEFVRRAAPPGADRFSGVDYYLAASGVPVLTDAIAFVDCTLEDEHVAGDHWLVVGRVHDVQMGPTRDPLVLWDRALGGFAAA